MEKIYQILIILILFSDIAFSEPLELKYFQSSHRYNYHIDLLNLAMDKTFKSDGPFLLSPVHEGMTLNRGLSILENSDKVNICFLASNSERESKYLSIKIPILRGLLGYRVSIIRKDTLKDFSNINSLSTLKAKFKAGFGNQWADMKILQANNIPVTGTAKYENLFKMLSAKRFDYFPRGINEAWGDLSKNKRSNPDLIIDPYIALYYPYPVYYFVKKKDVKLAYRVERGLNIALKDGSFKKLFFEYFEKIIQQADLKNRKIFILNNFTLDSSTVKPDTSWWLKIK